VGGHQHALPAGAEDAAVLGRRAKGVRIALAAVVLPLIVATIFGVIALWPSHQHHPVPPQFQRYGGGAVTYVTGRVNRLDRAPCGTATPGAPLAPTPCTEVRVSLAGGGTGTIEYPTGHPVGVPVFHVGDRVRLAATPNPLVAGGTIYTFDDFVRGVPLGIFAVIFAVLVIAVARWRGLAALLGLGFTYLAVVYFLLPALLDGKSPVQVALVTSAAVMVVVLYLAHGVSARTTTALLGTLISLLFAAILSGISLQAAHITGLSSEASTTLQSVTTNLSVTGLLLCAFIIGSLGVLNDMTVTQSSAVWELRAADPGASAWVLFGRAMRIGRDHIASAIYTLVFAYVGAALPLLLLLSLAGRSVQNVLTGDEVGTEILRSIVGAAGLVIAVPLTTALAALTVTASGRPADSATALRG
jgi:uncharacterized membrane protein